MTALPLHLGEYDSSREHRAVATIESFAVMQAGIDGALGLAGFFPLPGAATAAMIAALATQIPMYKSMAKELSGIYELPEDSITERYLRGGMLKQGAYMVAANLAVGPLAEQFGTDFLTEIAGDLFADLGLGFVGSIIPVLGGFVAVGLDVAIAATMTRRVGAMIRLYYMSKGWIGGSRKTHWHRAKAIEPFGADTHPVDDETIRRTVPEVRAAELEEMVAIIENLLEAAGPAANRQHIREMLRRWQFPDDLADEALDRVMPKPPKTGNGDQRAR